MLRAILEEADTEAANEEVEASIMVSWDPVLSVEKRLPPRTGLGEDKEGELQVEVPDMGEGKVEWKELESGGEGENCCGW